MKGNFLKIFKFLVRESEEANSQISEERAAAASENSDFGSILLKNWEGGGKWFCLKLRADYHGPRQ